VEAEALRKVLRDKDANVIARAAQSLDSLGEYATAAETEEALAVSGASGPYVV
jgi:hypothetical protein